MIDNKEDITKILKDIKSRINSIEYSNNSKDYLKILLTEYESLRDELKKNFDQELQIFIIIITALGVIYGIIFGYGIYDLLLLIPMFFFPFGLKSIYKTKGITLIGKYLKDEIEKKLAEITKDNHGWSGWQNYWMNWPERKKIVKRYDLSSKYLLFIWIPCGISFFYSIIILSVYNNSSFSNNILNQNRIVFINNSSVSISEWIKYNILFTKEIYCFFFWIYLIVLISSIVFFVLRKIEDY